MKETELATPCYVIDKGALVRNLEILQGASQRTGCKILLAQKAFSCFPLYPLMGQYLDGTAGSGLFEARLGKTEMGGECHVYAPAYREQDMTEILRYADHVVLNSPGQVQRFAQVIKSAGKSPGLRINPRFSTQNGRAIYDPCAPGSRLGTTLGQFDCGQVDLLEGLHMHTLCEQDAQPLADTVQVLEEQFGDVLHKMQWLNLGGGHHITRAGYDIPLLERTLARLRERYDVQVYLEPGEAVALNAGYFVTTVLDVWQSDEGAVAILDGSAACHMPDVLEMPYRPPLMHSGQPGEKRYAYRLGGPTCLAGDVIGDYAFDQPLTVGSRLVFTDMAIYTMVKNNTFNGIPLPSIYLLEAGDTPHLLRSFGYEDFRGRLG